MLNTSSRKYKLEQGLELGYSPYTWAANKLSIIRLEEYFASGGNVDECGPNGLSAIESVIMCLDKNTSKIEKTYDYLIGKGSTINVEKVYEHNKTLLHYAVSIGSYKIIKDLVDRGINVNVEDSNKCTALFHLSYAGKKCENYPEIVSLFVEKGANINKRNYREETPLIYASYTSSSCKLLEALIDNGAEIDAQDYEGSRSVVLAAFYQHFNFVKLLIDKGCDIYSIQEKLKETLKPEWFDEEDNPIVDYDGWIDESQVEIYNYFLEHLLN